MKFLSLFYCTLSVRAYLVGNQSLFLVNHLEFFFFVGFCGRSAVLLSEWRGECHILIGVPESLPFLVAPALSVPVLHSRRNHNRE